MPGHHRNKSLLVTNAHILAIAQRHYSTTTQLPAIVGWVVASQIVQTLLQVVCQQEDQKEKALSRTHNILNTMQFYDDSYFKLENVLQDEVLSRPDPEPLNEEKRSIALIPLPPNLKKVTKHRLDGSSLSALEESKVDAERREREILVQKLKKQYSSILKSKYISSSRPVGESRNYFMDEQSQEITFLRKNLSRGNVIIQEKSKNTKFDAEIRKGHKLNTVFKKSKAFIDRIDPTNSIFVSRIEHTLNTSHRNSVCMAPEETVTVRETAFRQITNSFKLQRQNQPRQLHKPQDSARLPSASLAALARENLKLRIQRSFHSVGQAKVRQALSSQRKNRGNSISGFLPKIK